MPKFLCNLKVRWITWLPLAAIGMGLNMDVDHVAFAGVRKFDGKTPPCLLNSAEIGQIAGRAGRHMNYGTFGVTNEARPLEREMVEAVECASV